MKAFLLCVVNEICRDKRGVYCFFFSFALY